MFENFMDCLGQLLKGLVGQGQFIEDNICDILCEVCKVLLEVDVVLLVVKEFVEQVKEKVFGQEVFKSFNSGQVFVKIVNDELVYIMGDVNDVLNLVFKLLVVIMMVGLQGVGKIIFVVKLVCFFQEWEKKKVMVVFVDVYWLVVIDQLEILVGEVKVEFFFFSGDQDLVDIVNGVLQVVCNKYMDVLIVDIVGCLYIRGNLMEELFKVIRVMKKLFLEVFYEVLLVLDVGIGQNVINQVEEFCDIVGVIGLVLIKLDGIVKGGILFVLVKCIGLLICFIGVGEQLEDLCLFNVEEFVQVLFEDVV